jgi:hypothetical protein
MNGKNVKINKIMDGKNVKILKLWFLYIGN